MNTNQNDFLNNVELNENLIVNYTNPNEVFMSSYLNILSININSIRNKIEDLNLYISQYKTTIHVICVTEIRVSQDELYLCHLDDYVEVCCPRSTRTGGGACFFMHRSIVFDVLVNEEFLEGSAIVVALRQPKIKLGVVYRPPHADLTESINFLDGLLETYNGLVCVGDFNINLLNPSSLQYKSMVISNGFSVLNKIDEIHFTYGNSTSGSILDHALTDLCNYEYSVALHDVSFTDHRALLVSLKGIDNIESPHEDTELLKYDFDSVSVDLRECIDQVTNLEDFCSLVTNLLRNNMQRIKIKPKNSRKSPWIDQFVLNQIRIREQLYRRTIEWPNNTQVKLNYRRQKNYVTNLIRQKQKLHYQRLIENNRHDIRKVWSIMNEIVFKKKPKNFKNNVTELLNNDTVVTNTTEICNIFNNYFVNVPHELQTNLLHNFMNQEQICTLNRSISSSFLLIPATVNEIENYIREMKSSSSAGIDLVPSKLLKQNAEVIVPKLTTALNVSMDVGVFPDNLKKARITPIYKKGHKNKADNYRPISILSALSKPFEKIIHDRLASFFSNHNLISKNQFGFQPRSNTTSATVSLINNIQSNIDQRRTCSAIFVDVSKAFDCVPHDVLLLKLDRYGVRGNAHTLIESYLSNRKQIVEINGHRSSEKVINYGVPQGSILGPLLFIIYINDIFDLPLRGTLQLYADDAVLVYSSDNIDQLYVDMQHDLNLINQWFFHNGLTVNASKTKYLIFSSTDRFSNIGYELNLGNDQIERVNSISYLGLTIQQNLKWNKHVENIHSKLTKFLGMLRRCSFMLPFKERKCLYYAHVHSQITYLNIIWQNAPGYVINKIAVTLNKFMRIIFWEQYNDPDLRTNDLYRINYMLNFNQIRYFEAVLFVYKVKNNLLKSNISLQSSREIHRYETRTLDHLRVSAPRTNYLRLGCMYTAIINYNNLPTNIKHMYPLPRFKKALKLFVFHNII